jgi:hypothetical protein
VDQQVRPDLRLTGDGLTVRRARCRTGRRDRAITRVHQALVWLDPDAGLPRSAILVVRRIEASLSGDPPRVVGVDLRGVAANAHRPLAAPPPGDCDALVFADEAELLVCLCRDIAGGRPLGWWWTAVLGRVVPAVGSLDRRTAMTAGFGRLPHAIPAAAAVAPRAVARAAAEMLPHEVLRVMGAMAEAHAAPKLAEVIRTAWHQALASVYGGMPGSTVVMPLDVPTSSSSPRLAGHRNMDVVEVLVETAQRLWRDPATARSAAAAHALARRLSPASPVVASPMRAEPNGAGPVEPVVPPAPASGLSTPPGPVAPPRTARGAPEAAAAGGVRPTSPADVTGRDGEPGDLADGDVDDRMVVSTAYGGAFYLLNLLERLDVPDSATPRGEAGALLTRWGVFALVVRTWPDVEDDDPLHAALDDLAWPDRHRDDHEELPDVGPWVAQVVDVLIASLADAGLEPDVVAVPARVEVGGFSVRVHMALDDIDLGVRRAGLDRDPGWVPALSRVVELLFT